MSQRSNKMKTNKMGQAKAIYSELAVARESATITCFLAETQRQAEEWQSFKVEKGQRPGTGAIGH